MINLAKIQLGLATFGLILLIFCLIVHLYRLDFIGVAIDLFFLCVTHDNILDAIKTLRTINL